MRIKQSFLLNGPQISDNLAGDLFGLDLAGTGIDGSSPGDITFFSIYLSIESTETEKELYDYVKFLKVFLESNDNYSGDYNSANDLSDILQLGDLGFGLSLYNPVTQDYDIVFNSSNYNSEAGAFVIKKEMMRYNDISDPSSPNLINSFGFPSATVNNASSGFYLEINESLFDERMVGCRVFNKDLNESAVITEYISPNSVVLSSDIDNTWDGDEVFVKQLLEPMDGHIAVNNSTALVLGNVAKLDFKFQLPSTYSKVGIKQFKLKFLTKL